MKNSESLYPEQIDPLIFYSDVDLNHADTIKQYQSLLSSGNYNTASEFLNNSDIDFYGAWLFNLIENELYAIETNADSIIGEKPNFVFYGKEITEEPNHHHWVGPKEVEKGSVEEFVVAEGSLLFPTEYTYDYSIKNGRWFSKDPTIRVNNGFLRLNIGN